MSCVQSRCAVNRKMNSRFVTAADKSQDKGRETEQEYRVKRRALRQSCVMRAQTCVVREKQMRSQQEDELAICHCRRQDKAEGVRAGRARVAKESCVRARAVLQ